MPVVGMQYRLVMSVTLQSHRSAWLRLASLSLSPKFVLGVIWIVIASGSIYSAPWGILLFWALMVIAATATGFALIGAQPLPPLKELSHLVMRLASLGKFATATAVLCLSTFLGALVGAQAGTADTQVIFDGASGLVGFVASVAAQGAAVVFLGWLVVDLIRMGDARRSEGIQRSALYVIRPWKWNGSGPVMRWLLALSSPAMAAISLAALLINLFLTLHQG